MYIFTFKGDNENLVVHCRKSASDSTKECRPFFIFTSRNRKCLLGVPSLDLNVFTKKDAEELIKNGLSNTEITDQEVEKLAVILQFFPLALRQAIAYINEQHEIRNVFGERYEIQNYFKAFDKQKEKLLEYPFHDDFGGYGKTTFITWNVTFDAIKADEENGVNAIRILQILAYLYADRIDSKIFLSLFQNDSTCSARAFLLLEKYSMISKIENSFYQIHRLVQVVVQSKFKGDEEKILEQAIQIIHPLFYESYLEKSSEKWNVVSLKQCTLEKLLHYNSLAIHTKKHKSLDKKFGKYLEEFSDGVYLNATVRDNVDEIKALNLSEKDLKEFIYRNIKDLMRTYSNNLITYFVENDFWD